MQWVRYGTEKKQISAEYYREEKHGEVFCRFCDGKMAYVSNGNRKAHFRVVDRKTHTCKYFGNDIEEIVAACSNAVRLDRKNNESPLITLNMDSVKGNIMESEESRYTPSSNLSIATLNFKASLKEKAIFKFIHDLHERFLKNEFDKVLQFRFVIEEGGLTKKLKVEEIIPNYKQIILLDSKGKLVNRKRFIVGTIITAKETIKKNIEVILRGEKRSDGSYINHKVIFMKYILEQQNLHISDFNKGRSIVVYAKIKMSDSKREIVSFVSNTTDFDFARYTSLDGDWVESLSKKDLDEFFYLRNIVHAVPDHTMAKQFFEFEGKVFRPDWVLFLRDKTIVVDYVESPNAYMNGPLELRRDYFLTQTEYHYLSIYKEDLEDNYFGLKKKLHKIQPNLQLNFYES